MARTKDQIIQSLNKAISEGDAERISLLSAELQAQPLAEAVERLSELKADQQELEEQLPAALKEAAEGRQKAIQAAEAVKAAKDQQLLVQRESGLAHNRAQRIRERLREIKAEQEELSAQLLLGADVLQAPVVHNLTVRR